jgi:hypothetical protein
MTRTEFEAMVKKQSEIVQDSLDYLEQMAINVSVDRRNGLDSFDVLRKLELAAEAVRDAVHDTKMLQLFNDVEVEE